MVAMGRRPHGYHGSNHETVHGSLPEPVNRAIPAAGRKGRPKQPSSGTFARQVRARPRPPVDVSNHQFQRQTAAEASTGRGLVLLGDTGGLRRGGSLTSSSSSSSGGGFGTAPVPRPVGVKRRQSSDIRSMFSSK